jgi:hypothetical protein
MRYTAGGGVTIEEYAGLNRFSYSGDCRLMTMTVGSSTVGVMLGERTIDYVPVGAVSTPGVHVVADHPVCAGETTLHTIFHWANVVQ